MKIKYLAAILPLSIFSSIAVNSSVQAQERQFACGSWRDIPATVAQTPQGNIPIIYWVSDWVDDPSSNLTPQNRCEIVSQNFQEASDRGELKYITTGEKNNQKIVCTSKTENGPCESQLFTLKPESDPNESLMQLMNIGKNYAYPDGEPLSQSTDGGLPPIYVEFDDFLQKAAESTVEDSAN